MLKPFVSFVFGYRKNQSAALSVLNYIEPWLRANFDRYEVIVVCNGPETHATELRQSFGNCPSVIHYLQLGREESFETAALVGLDKSIGDFVYLLEEAKVDFNPGLLAEMLEQSQTGRDVVFLEPGPSSLDLGTRCFYKVFNFFFRARESLAPSRVSLVSRRALNYVLDLNHLIRFHRILFILGGFRIGSIPYSPNKFGVTEEKSLVDRISLSKDLLLYYTSIGRSLSFGGAIAFSMFSVAVALYAVYSYLFVNQVVSGWTSLILFLSITFSGLFALLGVYGEYLQKVLVNVQGTPVYMVDHIESHTPLKIVDSNDSRQKEVV